MHQEALERLSSFAPEVRRQALRELVEAGGPEPRSTDWVNMHLHSFFSFNGEGWSPSRIAWEAKCRGLYAVAICDFDVLQGLEEMFEAADLLRLRAAVGFESRTFFREYAAQEINSPGEPGVFYFMGMGFAAPPCAGSHAAAVLADMLERSHARNRTLIARINAGLRNVQVDYERDVLPLTPDRNATERHIVRAYHEKALAEFRGDSDTAAAFWTARLGGMDLRETCAQITDTNAFLDKLRGKLMKKGGLGYQQPDETTFPALDTVLAMVRECRAVPMSTWLDGASEGESDPERQLDLLLEKGVEAVNIIPDRNWNLKDPTERTRKIAELDRYVAAATARDLPINVGTECNKPGQRFVDDFGAEAMARHHAAFLHGAQIMVGHTRLRRWADLSYIDPDADEGGRARRNARFAAVGALPGPAADIRARLDAMGPEKARAYLMDSARARRWL
ncbi:MAG: hypothetical protein JXR77_02285 [Lentisphaeria bacterium]|nr:hypothetical protein [Lentisphaeria bacterium]